MWSSRSSGTFQFPHSQTDPITRSLCRLQDVRPVSPRRSLGSLPWPSRPCSRQRRPPSGGVMGAGGWKSAEPYERLQNPACFRPSPHNDCKPRYLDSPHTYQAHRHWNCQRLGLRIYNSREGNSSRNGALGARSKYSCREWKRNWQRCDFRRAGKPLKRPRHRHKRTSANG